MRIAYAEVHTVWRVFLSRLLSFMFVSVHLPKRCNNKMDFKNIYMYAYFIIGVTNSDVASLIDSVNLH